MLSKRLKTIADMVDTKNIYDVGCDHGLLDIYLSKKNKYCIAIDKSEKCINKTLENMKKNNVSFECILNDGLKNINILSDSTVILSGLGTKTILEIIKDVKPNVMICQSNKNIYELRKNICCLGYYIEEEKIVFDELYYIIIKFRKGNILYTPKQLFLGPILLKNKDEIYYNYLLAYKNQIEKNYSKYDINKKEKYDFILKKIKEEI